MLSSTFEEVKFQLTKSNAKYKEHVDFHCHVQTFEEGEIVLIRLKKVVLPIGNPCMLHPRKFGPFQVLCKISYNIYVIDILAIDTCLATSMSLTSSSITLQTFSPFLAQTQGWVLLNKGGFGVVA